MPFASVLIRHPGLVALAAALLLALAVALAVAGQHAAAAHVLGFARGTHYWD